MTPCLDFWYCVYQNNYCNSVNGILLHRNVRECGMTVTNRGLLNLLKEDIQRIKKVVKVFTARNMSCCLSERVGGGGNIHTLIIYIVGFLISGFH